MQLIFSHYSYTSYTLALFPDSHGQLLSLLLPIPASVTTARTKLGVEAWEWDTFACTHPPPPGLYAEWISQGHCCKWHHKISLETSILGHYMVKG